MIALHLAFALLFPPLLIGVIHRVKAIAAGRRGQPILQVYFDLAKLARKGTVMSTSASWVFFAGPVATVVTSLAALALLPLGAERAPLAFEGDLVLFAYLLGLGRFCTVLSALDTGSAFEGMGAAREATFACLAEPALLLGLFAGAHLTGTTSLSAMLGSGAALPWSADAAPMLLVLVSLFIVMLVENSRVPFDDPNTHLELTMVHEVMVLDHSGPALGLVELGAAQKLFLFAALLVRWVLPLQALPAGLGWPAVGLGVLGVAALVGVVESVMARLRLVQVPRMLISACLLSAFGLLLIAR